MSLLIDFINRVETFLENTGMTATKFGEMACNDPNFVFDLRAGRSPHMKTVDKVDQFMRDNSESISTACDDGLSETVSSSLGL